MGILGFFDWITKRYPLISRSMKDPSRPLVDCLFLDFNPVLYQALNRVQGLDDKDHSQLFTEAFRLLDLIVQINRPTSLIYISIDGVAPFAKRNEQRTRRFARKTSENNQISVGTEFMESFHQNLLDFLKHKVETDPNWQLPSVYYSSFKVPGEGEHKIFNFIHSKRESNEWNENAVCFIFTTDPDLIFMCMTFNIKNCSIILPTPLYDSPFCLNDFTLIHIGLIREYLLLDFEGIEPNDFNSLVDDFATITFLIGNDFIPEVPELNISTGDFNRVIDVYKRVFIPKHMFIVENGVFNKNNLKLFFEELSNMFSKDSNDIIENEKELVFSVLDSYYFTLEYYKFKCPSWSWCYQFERSPPLKSIYTYIDEYEPPNFTEGVPHTSFEQLISILPPESSSLLPEPLRPLLSEEKLSREIIQLQFSKVVKQISKEDLVRNEVCEDMLIGEKTSINNVHFDVEYPPCVPSLNFFKFDVIRKLDKIEIFVQTTENSFKNASDIKSLLDKVVLVDWPYLKPALVISVSDEHTSYTSHRKDHIIANPSTDCNELTLEVKLVHFTDPSECELVFDDEITKYPYKTCSSISINSTMKRFKPQQDNEPTVGMSAYLPEFGIGKIIQTNPIQLLSQKQIPSAHFASILVMDKKNWVSLGKLSDLFSLKEPIMIKVLTDISTKENPLNIGFNLYKSRAADTNQRKYNIEYKKLNESDYVGKEEYVKQFGTEFHFSTSIIKLLNRYFEITGLLHSILMQIDNEDSFDVIYDSMISGLKNREKYFQNISKWLTTNLNKPLVSLNNILSSKKAHRKIENIIRNLRPIRENREIQVDSLDKLLWIGKKFKHDKISLGNRVICVGSGGLMPFGAIGTVVDLLYDKKAACIISDDELKYGCKLLGRLETNRGFLVPTWNLINIQL